jgi:hypothetical protein
MYFLFGLDKHALCEETSERLDNTGILHPIETATTMLAQAS